MTKKSYENIGIYNIVYVIIKKIDDTTDENKELQKDIKMFGMESKIK